MSGVGTRCVVASMLLILVGSSGIASEGSRYLLSVPDGPRVSFLPPADWEIVTREAGPSVTVELSPASGGDFLVLVTIFPSQPDSPVSSPKGLRATVDGLGKESLSGAVQDAIELLEVGGGEAIGYLYHLTDGNPEKGPGDYREATQGMMLFAPYVATVTILTNTGDDGIVERAIELLQSIKLESEAPAHLDQLRGNPLNEGTS